jgi:ubiquinone/menaquinone biosynthesis C-methylase UbiE
MPEFDATWETVYRERATPMKYPFEVVVRFIMRHLGQLRRTQPDARPRLLEVGCGMGNNLWFAAREGCEVTGFDAVPEVIEYARARFAADGLQGNLSVGLFGKLPYADASFDLALDFGGLTCTGRSVAAETIREVQRVLVPGGKFLFTPFSTDDLSFTASDPGPDETRINITAGTVRGVGQICFYSRTDLEATLGSGWRLLSLELNRHDDLLHNPPIVRAVWHAIVEKL